MQILKSELNYKGKRFFILVTRFYPYANRDYSLGLEEMNKEDFIFVTYVDGKREERFSCNGLEENYAIWRMDKEIKAREIMFKEIGDEVFPILNNLQFQDEYDANDDREIFDPEKLVVVNTDQIFCDDLPVED